MTDEDPSLASFQPPEPPSMPVLQNRLTRPISIMLLALWTLHGALALLQLLSIPSESRGFLFGASAYRLVAGGAIVLWIAFSAALLLRVLRRSPQLGRLITFLQRPAIHDGLLLLALFILVFRLFLAVMVGLFDKVMVVRYGAYIERLLPLMDLAAFVSLEALAVMVFFRLREPVEVKLQNKAFIQKLLLVLLVLGVTSATIAVTHLGIAPVYRGDWGFAVPAVPLMEWQLLLACIFCVAVVIAEGRPRFAAIPHLDTWIAVLIWLAAVLVWLSQPPIPHSIALAPRAPNYEIYPFNDAQTYDTYAQSLLTGSGFGSAQVPQRPLFALFLALLHGVVGQDYGRMVAAQTLFLALFPVLLYLFGKEFFGRPVGLSMAVLAISRDYLSNLVSPVTGNLSFSKLFLSEIPTAMFLILFLWLGIRWLGAGCPGWLAFLMGGVLGAGMLVRTQVVVALPVMLLFVLLLRPAKWSALARSVSLLLLALALVISPWLVRNRLLTGSWIFDHPASQSVNLALRYSRINNERVDVRRMPGETIGEYQDRLVGIAAHAISQNPGGAFLGVSSYFLNHAVNNVLLLPLRNDLRDPGELWVPRDAFWEKWAGQPTSSQSWLLASFALLLGLGIAAAWHRNGLIGLLPLALNLAYNLWTSLALLSGERFMLSMDWSIYAYYMIGFFALISAIMYLLKTGRPAILKWYQRRAAAVAQPASATDWRRYLLAGLLFLAIGTSVPLSEKLFPERYPPLARAVLVDRLMASAAAQPDQACLQHVLADTGTSIIQGRALYPRYYPAGEGEPFTDAAGYKIVEQNRLVFELVGQQDGRMIIPLAHEPAYFPHAADVTLVMDAQNNVLFMLVEKSGVSSLYLTSNAASYGCR
jgi:hypothetical protein